jgi:hemolysin activation/secretion protein
LTWKYCFDSLTLESHSLWLFWTHFVTFLLYKNKRLTSAIGTGILLFGLSAIAQSPPLPASLPANLPDPAIELRRQQEQERALRSQQESNTNVQLKTPTGKETGKIPTNEATCFKIDRLLITSLKPEEIKAFEWLIPYASALDPKRGFFTFTRPDNFDSPIGQCLGANGINTVITRMQNALVARGYTTSRVLAKAQDLKSGTLNLHLMLGRIKDIRYTSTAKSGIPSYPQQPDPKPSQFTALPMDSDDIVNLRDIEMALENFKRVPTADADIQIEPSKAKDAVFGDSDLVIKQEQKSPYRRSVGLSDSGSSSTGKYQSNATLSLDQLFWANDLFYVTLNGDVLNGEFKGKDLLGRGSQGYIFHYSVPVGYWGVESTISRNAYYQTVIGATRNYIYSGTSNNAEVKLSRMVYRDSTAKVTTSLKAWQRKSNNYIDDAEVDVQRRIVGGFDLGLYYRQLLGQSSIDTTWVLRQGTNAFGSMPAPEELFGEGSSRMRMLTADTTLTHPFQISDKKLKYTANWRAQWERNKGTDYLLAADRFAIGGRYTVRGYDNASLSAENGYFIRQDLAITIPTTQVDFYVGYDYGQVFGASDVFLAGKHLTGAALGFRGRAGNANSNLSFDVFWATPISKPDAFRSAGQVTGFTATYNF